MSHPCEYSHAGKQLHDADFELLAPVSGNCLKSGLTSECWLHSSKAIPIGLPIPRSYEMRSNSRGFRKTSPLWTVWSFLQQTSPAEAARVAAPGTATAWLSICVINKLKQTKFRGECKAEFVATPPLPAPQGQVHHFQSRQAGREKAHASHIGPRRNQI